MTDAPKPEATEETGAISGLVTDDELVSIPGASVLLDTAERITTISDAEGRFTFNEILPGNHNLVIDALGYYGAQRAIQVGAGEVVEVRIVLKPLPVNASRNETFIADAFFGLAISVPGLFHSDVLGNSVEDFSYPLGPEVAGVVSAAQWQATTPLTAQRMQLQLYTDGSRTCTASRAVCGQGVSPIHVRWDTIQDIVKGREGRSLGVSVMPVSCEAASCPNQPPSHWAQLSYEQRVKVYTTVFYIDPAPAGYSPLPS